MLGTSVQKATLGRSDSPQERSKLLGKIGITKKEMMGDFQKDIPKRERMGEFQKGSPKGKRWGINGMILVYGPLFLSLSREHGPRKDPSKEEQPR